jgi:hypothetical protein
MKEIKPCKKCGQLPDWGRTDDNDYFYTLKCNNQLCDNDYEYRNAIEEFCLEQWNKEQAK